MTAVSTLAFVAADFAKHLCFADFCRKFKERVRLTFGDQLLLEFGSEPSCSRLGAGGTFE